MKIFLFLIFLVAFDSSAFSQSKSVNQKGWELPNVVKLESNDEMIKVIDDIPVTEKTFKIIDTKPTILTKVEKASKGKITTFWEVRKAISFSHKNAVFAYYFSYVPFTISEYQSKKNESIKIKEYIGISFSFYYVDEDGDGKFETKYSALKMKLRLPNRIKI